ncbi:2436_t:CDS:1 [Funneliformis geosporum]|uniref:8192_t:CDS:1 n=1 Tax=Funneliformis geosporum TaxID=1117311 RepID=A0A9W4SJ34_9GLOM|nr:8192_t:CDS:1 [Funneliformis geosporum]CAI2177551.1 2436_t:CDS:1 [Funneliformis geosporum]
MSSSSTVFTKPVLKTKKPSKIKLLFLVLGRVIKNNPLLFLFCSLLAVITAVINFNIGVNVKNLVLHKEKTLSEQVIKEIEREGGEEKKGLDIQKERIREILKINTDATNQRQKEVKENIENEIKGNGSLKKEEIKEIIEKASVGGRRIDQLTDFEFEFNFFGLH